MIGIFVSVSIIYLGFAIRTSEMYNDNQTLLQHIINCIIEHMNII